MSDKFNGFSQDEINRVSGQKNKKLPIDNGSEYLEQRQNLHDVAMLPPR